MMSSRFPIGVVDDVEDTRHETSYWYDRSWTNRGRPDRGPIRHGAKGRTARMEKHSARNMYSSEPLPHFVDDYLAWLHET